MNAGAHGLTDIARIAEPSITSDTRSASAASATRCNSAASTTPSPPTAPGSARVAVASAATTTLSRREADIAVRLVRPKEPALIARRLGQMRFSLFASAAYLDRAGTPRTLKALSSHDFVGFDASLDELPQTRWLRRVLAAPRYVVRANTTVAQVLACAEGHGIALLPTFVAGREPRLQRLLPRLLGPSREMWGVTHADMRGNPRAAAVLDWLAGLAAP